MVTEAEQEVTVPGGKVWTRTVGDGPVALVLLHGGPGVPHDYLLSHDSLAEKRRLVYYDQLGCGLSERPDDPSLWNVERFVAELAAVRDALGLDRVYLLGQSWGGCLALAYMLEHPNEGVEGLILSSAPASAAAYAEDARLLLKGLPSDARAAVAAAERSGNFDSLAYKNASKLYDRTYVCRLEPWPDLLLQAESGFGKQVFETMWGPSDFTVTGNFKDWDASQRLTEISVPTLVLGGRYDTVRPERLTEIARALPNGVSRLFESSAHMPVFEEPDAYFGVLSSFLDRTEAGSFDPRDAL